MGSAASVMGCASSSPQHNWESAIKNSPGPPAEDSPFSAAEDSPFSADFQNYVYDGGDWQVGTRQADDQKETNHLKHDFEIDEERGSWVLTRSCVSACGPDGRLIRFEMRYEGSIISSNGCDLEPGGTHEHRMKLSVETIGYHDTLASVLENDSYSFIVMQDKNAELKDRYSIKGGTGMAPIEPFELKWDPLKHKMSAKGFASMNISEDGLEIYFGGDATSEVPWCTFQLAEGRSGHLSELDDD